MDGIDSTETQKTETTSKELINNTDTGGLLYKKLLSWGGTKGQRTLDHEEELTTTTGQEVKCWNRDDWVYYGLVLGRFGLFNKCHSSPQPIGNTPPLLFLVLVIRSVLDLMIVLLPHVLTVVGFPGCVRVWVESRRGTVMCSVW